MIRFGPAGIPLSCKGRTLRDGIEDVHALGLTAMEVQLVRVNLIERYAGEEEVGSTLRNLSGELVVGIRRTRGKKEEMIQDLDGCIERGDVIYSLASGIARDYHELEELGKLAKELDIELSLHTPYYMDLAADGDLAYRSLDGIRWGGLLAQELGCSAVTTHMGLYGELSKKEAMKRITANIKAISEWYEKHGIEPKLGLETSGRQEVFGSFEEVLSLCKSIEGVVPVLNFAHIHSREGGSLKTKEDFEEVFDKVSKYVDGHYHSHFSGVEHEGGNELRYTPIKRGDLRFEPLAECILEGNYDVTVVSSSPLLEHDAMYMKVILERVLARKFVKRKKVEEE